MGLGKIMPGSWETEYRRFFRFRVKALYSFKKDGTLTATVRYKSRIVQLAMVVWKPEYRGTWGVESEDEVEIRIEGLSTYPTRLIDQVLKTLKIHVSVDEFVSTLTGIIYLIMKRGKASKVEVVNSDSIKIKGIDLHRRT